jgi:hypothetical protein
VGLRKKMRGHWTKKKRSEKRKIILSEKRKKISPNIRCKPNKGRKQKQKSQLRVTMVGMKGISWNCKGLAKEGKFEFLRELINKENADFICLQETNKKIQSKLTGDIEWLKKIRMV